MAWGVAARARRMRARAVVGGDGAERLNDPLCNPGHRTDERRTNAHSLMETGCRPRWLPFGERVRV